MTMFSEDKTIDISSGDDDDILRAMDDANPILLSNDTNPTCTKTVAEDWPNFIRRLEERQRGDFKPIPTGVTSLDRLLEGGLPVGMPTVLAAPPGTGKTSFALGLAWITAQSVRPVLYASYELEKDDVFSRLGSLVARKPWGKIRSGNDIPAVIECQSKLDGLPLYVCDDLELPDIDAIKRKVTELKEQHGIPPLVIVDFVQDLCDRLSLDTGEKRDRNDVVSLALRELAKKQKIPLLLLSSVGRASYNMMNGDKIDYMTAMKASKESGRWESDAAVVLVFVRAGQDDDNSGNQRLWIVCAKNRLGRQGQIAVEYKGLSGQFVEIPEDRMPVKPAKMTDRQIDELILNVVSKFDCTTKTKIADRLGGNRQRIFERINDLINKQEIVLIDGFYRLSSHQTGATKGNARE